MFFRLLFLSFTTFSLLPLYAGDIVGSDAVQSSKSAPEVVDMDALAKQSTVEVVDMDALAKQSTAEVVDMDALAKQSTPEIVDMDTPETASPAVMSAQSVDTADMTKHVIIAGTFKEQVKADEQLVVLAFALNTRPEIVALKQAYGFEYISRPSGKYFVVAIEPVYGRETLKKVLAATREVFADAYEYVRTTKTVPVAVSPVKVETVKPKPVISEAVVVEESPIKSAPAVAPAVESPKVEPEPTVDDLDSSRQVLKKAAARAVNTPPVAPPSMPADAGTDDMLMYGGIAVVVVLLLLIVMMRGKKEKAAEEEPTEAEEESGIEVVASPAEEEKLEEVEVPVSPVPEEPLPEVAEEPMAAAEKIIEEVSVSTEPPVVEESVTEVVEEVPVPTEEIVEEVSVPTVMPVIEELVTEITEEVPVAAVEEVPEVSTGVQRKKREPKPGRGKINKDDLAEFSGNRILMAEDNLINQKVINALLADSGMEIVIANDGQEAVDTLASDSNFQMIFMDAHMPIKDGFEASREIRANVAYDHIPIVALSGDIGVDDLRAMAEAGMEEQLAKPVHLEDLYDVMYCYFDIEEEESAEEEDLEFLPETDELNAEDGLEICGGDEELYKEILNDFVATYGKSDEILNGYLVHDDADAAKAMLLDIRGIAANIGAMPLAETAGLFREAILDGKEAKYTPLYESYCGHLRKLLVDIEKI